MYHFGFYVYHGGIRKTEIQANTGFVFGQSITFSTLSADIHRQHRLYAPYMMRDIKVKQIFISIKHSQLFERITS